jgi:hypothetical protein
LLLTKGGCREVGNKKSLQTKGSIRMFICELLMYLARMIKYHSS